MVIDQLLLVVTAMVRSFIGLLPVWTAPVEDSVSSFQSFGAIVGNYVQMVNQWFPVDTLVIVLLAILGVRVALSGWNILTWLWEKIPFWG